MKKSDRRIGIIGAGPAGLAASITAGLMLKASGGFQRWKIDLFEKNSEPGKKILATGNGKCNITNESAENHSISHSFLNDLGILLTKDEEGRMYPYSKQAGSVRDTLVAAAVENNVKIMNNTNIKSIRKKNNYFLLISSDGKEYDCEKLIIATGGKAGIQYGSDGAGYKFARDLGLEVKPILPALVAMTYGENNEYDLKKLKGVRATAELVLTVDEEKVAERSGEIQFTDYGISGICTFDLSRFLRDVPREKSEISGCSVLINLVPDITESELINLLEKKLPAGLKGIINDKVISMLLDTGLDPKKDIKKIVKTIKNLQININGTKGWKEAQVTSGGVALDEIHMNSMKSKKINNLFFAGEVLDYDGPCGGYNLNWAWKTGIQAGLGVVDGIEVDDKTL